MAKVLFVSNDFPPSVGGIAQVMKYMCASLPPEQVCVLAQNAQGDKQFDNTAPYKVYRTPYSSSSKIHSVLSVAKYAKALRQVFRKEHCDYIFYDKAYPLGLISHQPLRPDAPYIVQAYGNDIVMPRSRIEKQLQAKILCCAERVIAISNFTKGLLLDLGVAPGKIVVIFPKMDFERFDAADITQSVAEHVELKNKKVILSVGRLVRRKGFDMTIRAMPEILKKIPNAYYLLVGNGPDLQYLETLAKDCGVAEHVKFVTDCDDNALPAYYRACDVFCMPSRYIKEKGDVEGFGIVFLEANASGKPVVGGNSGGQPNAIEDGKTGFLCDPESPADIADKIITILNDPVLAGEMGQYGYDRAKQKFQAQHYCEELQSLFS